ncbi:MAG: replication initiation factor domain-containing protein, partial [Planctomycetota bacterium]
NDTLAQADGGPAKGTPPIMGGEMAGPAADGCDSPPLVTRGAKLHEGEVGIDWVTVTMPRLYLEDVTRRLEEYLGPSNIGKGFNGYSAGRHFAYGAGIAYSDEERLELCVNLSGDTCSRLGPRAILELVSWAFQQDGKATRIDVRVDFKSENLNLIDLVRASCERGELCRCRRWKPEEPRTNDGDYLGRGINLGLRGKKGSGRYVRIYDKGLETGESPARTWERWETVFSKDSADQVAHMLIDSADWKCDALAAALGAVDFHEVNGSASLIRRPLASWWVSFLAGVKPILVKAQRTPTNLHRWGGWMRRSVIRTLKAISRETGLTVDAIISYLEEGKPLPVSKSPVVWEFIDNFEPPM